MIKYVASADAGMVTIYRGRVRRTHADGKTVDFEVNGKTVTIPKSRLCNTPKAACARARATLEAMQL